MAERTNLLSERDYAKTPLTAEEVETILGPANTEAVIRLFLNTRHPTYKERNFASALPARGELIPLIIAEPNLLRRPITRRGNELIIGFDQDALSNLMRNPPQLTDGGQ